MALKSQRNSAGISARLRVAGLVDWAVAVMATQAERIAPAHKVEVFTWGWSVNLGGGSVASGAQPALGTGRMAVPARQDADRTAWVTKSHIWAKNTLLFFGFQAERPLDTGIVGFCLFACSRRRRTHPRRTPRPRPPKSPPNVSPQRRRALRTVPNGLGTGRLAGPAARAPGLRPHGGAGRRPGVRCPPVGSGEHLDDPPGHGTGADAGGDRAVAGRLRADPRTARRHHRHRRRPRRRADERRARRAGRGARRSAKASCAA